MYILCLCSDNGGPAAGFDLNYASNWPLRGVGLIFCTFSLFAAAIFLDPGLLFKVLHHIFTK
jgi:hypothetical protein